MKHLMIDLETMDNKPTSAIASIGAVFFDPETGEMGEQFYQRVSLGSCVGHGLTMGSETVLWWMRQDAEARSELLNDDCLDLPLTLANLELLLLSILTHLKYRYGGIVQRSTMLFYVMHQRNAGLPIHFGTTGMTVM